MISNMSGKLEARTRKRARRGQIESMILGALVIGGVLTLAAAAPKTLQLLRYVDLGAIVSRDPRKRLRETASRLKRKGLIKFVVRHGKTHMQLTEKGSKFASSIASGTHHIRKPLRWDGRWRLVIFDISEKRRPLRDRVRRLMHGLGFYRLQDSVWVHPYECEEIIAILKTDMRIGRELLYVIADAIEFDKPLRAHFKL